LEPSLASATHKGQQARPPIEAKAENVSRANAENYKPAAKAASK